MRRAFVTGIAGQTGSYLAEQLIDAGWIVHGYAKADNIAGAMATVTARGAIVHQGDLTDSARLTEVVDSVAPHAVFHLGGLSSVAESWRRPVEFAQVTAMPTATLLAAAAALQERRGSPVSFVNASSAEIFGEPSEVPQTEATRIAPVSPYGSAKAYGHHLVRAFRAAGLVASNCILYNHESPRRPHQFVMRTITRGVAQIARGKESRLVLGSLDPRRDWGWAPDYADALHRAATVADDFVIASGVARSIGEVVAAAFRVVGITDWESLVEIDPSRARPIDPPVLVGDSSRARQVLGWEPTVGFDEMVRLMVEADLAEIDGDEAP